MGIATAIAEGLHVFADFLEYWNAPDVRKAKAAAREQARVDQINRNVAEAIGTGDLTKMRKDEAE